MAPLHASSSLSSRWARLLRRWWRQQSPARQDRFATIGPLVSVLMFLAAITASFWYLRNEEIERVSDALRRDTEVAQQQIRLHLIENQEQLVRMARELATRDIDGTNFLPQATAFQRERPEVRRLVWLNNQRRVRAALDVLDDYAPAGQASVPPASLPSDMQPPSAPEQTFRSARLTRQKTHLFPGLHRGRQSHGVPNPGTADRSQWLPRSADGRILG